jgi:hypothetical protein
MVGCRKRSTASELATRRGTSGVGGIFWCAREAPNKLLLHSRAACHAGRHVFIGASHFSIMGREGDAGHLALAAPLILPLFQNFLVRRLSSSSHERSETRLNTEMPLILPSWQLCGGSCRLGGQKA